MKKDNQNRVTHGGEGAVKRLRAGKALIGLAAEAQNEVEATMGENGPVGLIRQNAIRLQTCCDLYWAAVVKAAESGDLQALDRYTARFGWLAGCALRALAQAQAAEKAAEKADKGAIDAILRPYREPKEGTDA